MILKASRIFLRALSVDALAKSPASLAFDRKFDVARPEVRNSFLGKLLLRIGGYYGLEARRRRGANNLYDAICEQGERPGFYAVMQMDRQKFAYVHNVLGLHVWLLIRRLEEVEDSKKLVQLVYDQFLHDVEIRVHRAGVKVRMSQRLEDLERRFYGRCLAYDACLGEDAKETLKAALLRNVYDDVAEKTNAARILEKYLLREMECLRLTETGAVVQGRIKFTDVAQAERASKDTPRHD